MQKLILKFSKTDWIYILILAVLCVVGYWQIGFGVHPLKWDVIDYYFPSRFMVGEILQSHSLPLWNPYQTLGYPIHADPQSGTWYPIAWIIGLFHGYTLNLIGFEFLLHIFIGSWGMFILGKTLNYDKKISFILAIAYLFSGFFVGNAQHLTWTISGAWLPFVLNQFLVLYKKRNFYNAALLALWAYLFLSAGYPAFVFVTVYILVILLALFTYKEYKLNKIKGILNYYKYLLISLIIVMICSSIIVISNYYALPFLTRGGSITPEMAIFCPFSPQCSLSFITPLAVVGQNTMEFFKTDLSMTNGYFGIIILVFSVLGLWGKKRSIQWLFVLFAFFSLLASFGAYTPVRMFLYDWVPLMNTFRFPALFRLFFIFFFILIAGNSLQSIFFTNKKIPLPFYVFSGLFIVIMIVFIFVFRGQGYLDIKNVVLNQLFTFSSTSSFKQHFAVHALFQIVFLSLAVFLLFKYKTSSKTLAFIAVLVVFEMMLSTQLNAPYTINDPVVYTKDAQAYLNTFPRKFPIPNTNAILTNEKDIPKQPPFWKNTSMYNKQVSHEGFTPFIFKDFKYLTDTIPEFFDEMLKNPLVYLSSSIYSTNDFETLSKENKADSSAVFLSHSDYLTLKENIIPDTLVGNIHISKFSPTHIEIECEAVQSSMVVLLQNNYYGWTAKVNNTMVPIYKANYTTMAVPVSAGKNTIVFNYQPKNIIIAYSITIISFFILLFYLLIAGLMNARKNETHSE
ncbi:MAG: YfhO family protein [Bacteroidales bacterium]|nr:YfhO family protein [Bacteroidales bacterium]MDY0216577.1 YfhO family protein [Bacteroidales bacterium]